MTPVLRPSIQGIAFVSRLAPEPRRAITLALAALRKEKRNFSALEGNLSGYYRFRVGRHRVNFSYEADGAIEAVFIEERQLVYEVLEAQFTKRQKS